MHFSVAHIAKKKLPDKEQQYFLTIVTSNITLW